MNKDLPINKIIQGDCLELNRKYIYSTQISLFNKGKVIGFGTDEFCIKEISKQESNKIIIENHYSHKTATDAHTRIPIGVFLNGKIMGALQFGYAMNPCSMDKIVANTKIDEYLELNRMWLDDELGKNSESKAISYSIKYIKKMYPKIKWIQSFADERCGKLGLVYQAANFKYIGSHITTFWEIDGEFYHKVILENGKRKKGQELKKTGKLKNAIKHNLRQFRYIFFIKKNLEKKLLYKVLLYPKHYAE